MKYTEFAEACEKISTVSKRLEIRTLLSELLAKLSSDEVGPALYMLQGQLRPEYEGVEVGVGEALALKALASVTSTDVGKLKEAVASSGDLGETAFQVLSASHLKNLSEDLLFKETYDLLTQLTRTTGKGSQDSKTNLISSLLKRASPLEAKHLLRFLLGKLRLGVKEMTILDALAEIHGGSDVKAARERIESAFNVTSDLGEIGCMLASGGLSSLDHVGVTLGKPVRPMLAEREATLAAVMERMGGESALEFKYDGLRIQAHVYPDGKVKLFSRRLEELSAQFPDVVGSLPPTLKISPVIVEGECVPFDLETGELRPFQDISRRRGRKYDLESMMEEVPVKMLLFDILLDGKASCLSLPYPERRRRLKEIVKKSERVDLSCMKVVRSVSDGEEFFQNAISSGCEGVVAKSLSPSSVYKAGARGFLWIKYKREYTHQLADTVDAVIVGAYWGRGRRAGWFGAFLMSLYDRDREAFPTLCKVGSGFDETGLAQLTDRLKPSVLKERPEEVDSTLNPDVWLSPEVVIELRGAELSLSPVHRVASGRIREGYGLALRFPRFTGRMRDDKSPTDCTRVAEAIRLYETQVRKVETSPKL